MKATASGGSTRPVAVVVGGGPAGALTAKTLCAQGFDVQLYEAYPRPNISGNESAKSRRRRTDANNSRNYNISINTRGQNALKRCGIDPMRDLEEIFIPEARVFHPPSLSRPCRVIKTNKAVAGSVGITRRALAARLMDVAEREGAKISCGWRLVDIDFEQRVATFREGKEGKGPKLIQIKYDLLVGADGVNSQTRTLLSGYVNSIGEKFDVRLEKDTMEYQVATLPRSWREILEDEIAARPPLDTCPLITGHVWNDVSRGSTALASCRNDFSITLIFPGGELWEMRQAGSDGYTPALSALLPDWTTEARLELAQLLSSENNEPNTGGVCVWTSALAHPPTGVVLIGDSGHGMWPSLGQGCNAALESVSIFADAIEAAKEKVSSKPERQLHSSCAPHQITHAICHKYNSVRHKDALAAVDLTYGGIGGVKARGVAQSPMIFKVQMMLFIVLYKLTRGLVPMPAMRRILRGEDVRYSTLKRAMGLERVVTWGVLVCIGMLLVAQFRKILVFPM